jgi:CheY-like chemotaxis protein
MPEGNESRPVDEPGNGMKSRRVLLYVDDCDAINWLVKRFFERSHPDCEVLIATSVADAWERIEARRGTPEFPDAVITDFRLGEAADGPALVERIREQFPHVRAIVVSATLAPDDLRRAYDSGAHAVIEKELNAQQFVNKLFNLIEPCRDNIA